MSKRPLNLLVVAVLAALTAYAAPFTGSFDFGPFHTTVTTNNTVWTSTIVDFSNGGDPTQFNFISNNTGDFASSSDNVTSGPKLYFDFIELKFAGPGSYLFGHAPFMHWTTDTNDAAEFDTTQFSITQTAPSGGNPGVLAIAFYGWYKLNGGTGVWAQANLSVAQTGEAKNWTGTFGIPGGEPPPLTPTPEPASMGVVGAALLGAGLFGRRLVKR
jgi:hypothetical protein